VYRVLIVLYSTNCENTPFHQCLTYYHLFNSVSHLVSYNHHRRVVIVILFARQIQCNLPAIERVQALADISPSALYAFAVYKAISLHTCVVIATKPVHRLQIRPILYN